MSENHKRIGRAYNIAKALEDEKWSPEDAMTILAMALGIFAEGVDGGHRELSPLMDGMIKAAQIAFDGLRDSRLRDGGTA